MVPAADEPQSRDLRPPDPLVVEDVGRRVGLVQHWRALAVNARSRKSFDGLRQNVLPRGHEDVGDAAAAAFAAVALHVGVRRRDDAGVEGGGAVVVARRVGAESNDGEPCAGAAGRGGG